MTNIGKRILYPYCNGFISKEFDLEGAVIVLEGLTWIVVLKADGFPEVEHFRGWEDKKQLLIDEWTTPGTQEW